MLKLIYINLQLKDDAESDGELGFNFKYWRKENT
jgi:hypothetical protein